MTLPIPPPQGTPQEATTGALSVRAMVRRIEDGGASNWRVTIHTGSTRDARSNEYWDKRLVDPDMGPLRSWMDTRRLYEPARKETRRRMRTIPVLRADIGDYTSLQRPVLHRVLERLRLDGGKLGRRTSLPERGRGQTNISLKIVRELDRLQTIQEDEVVEFNHERIDWYDPVDTSQTQDCDGRATWRLEKMEQIPMPIYVTTIREELQKHQIMSALTRWAPGDEQRPPGTHQHTVGTADTQY